MYLHICDICQMPISKGKIRYILALNKIKSDESEIEKGYYTTEDFMDKLRDVQRKIKVYEICESCKKVLDHFFKLRKKEIDKIKKELNFLEKESDNE